MMESGMIRQNLTQIDRNKVTNFVHDRDNKTRDIWTSQAQDASEKLILTMGKSGFHTIGIDLELEHIGKLGT